MNYLKKNSINTNNQFISLTIQIQNYYINLIK